MRKFIILLFTLNSIIMQGQQGPGKTRHDDFVKRFNLTMDTVQWLVMYDDIAWWTSDSVYATPKEEQAKLGSEWFCYVANGIWHAMYGKYQNGNFDMIYHYTVDSINKIVRTREVVDSGILNPYARALLNGRTLANNFPDTIKVRCNQYIKKNEDNTFSVWFLPAFTTNGIAVYGGEFYYLYDKSGNNLISRNEYSIGYRGFKPDTSREILIDYENFSEPPLSAVFFAWYYKGYFNRVKISTKNYVSTPFRVDQSFSWVHAEKE